MSNGDVAVSMNFLATSVVAMATSVGPGGSTDITSIVGLLNYGVLGILTIGFIRGWVVSPRERDRLVSELDATKADLKVKDAEIARLNEVIQENLQAMTATMDKQIDLATARMRREESTSHGGT